MITIAGGKLLFHHPEQRIREYCELEVYQGYDNFHSIDNTITKRDIEATRRIFSMIDQHGHSESTAILNSLKSVPALSMIPDLELGEIKHSEWQILKRNITSLLDAFHEIKYVGLAKTRKSLHLKRPHLFPILDSYVVELLTGKKLSDVSHYRDLTDVAVRALEIAHEDITQNLAKYKQLQQKLLDLPIPLTIVRMYDILCWTTWKWDVLGIKQTTKWIPTNSGYRRQTGYASKTLLKKVQLKKIKPKITSTSKKIFSTSRVEGCSEINTLQQFDKIVNQRIGIIVILDSTGNKIHRTTCKWIKKSFFREKVIINRKRNGRYFWCKNYKDAMISFRTKDCNSCII
jgi:hypothetical protein